MLKCGQSIELKVSGEEAEKSEENSDSEESNAGHLAFPFPLRMQLEDILKGIEMAKVSVYFKR